MNATLIALYTEPQYSVTLGSGDECQGFEFLFRVDDWSGTIAKNTDETTNAAFFSQDNLPEFEPGFWADHEREVLEDYNSFSGVPKSNSCNNGGECDVIHGPLFQLKGRSRGYYLETTELNSNGIQGSASHGCQIFLKR